MCSERSELSGVLSGVRGPACPQRWKASMKSWGERFAFTRQT